MKNNECNWGYMRYWGWFTEPNTDDITWSKKRREPGDGKQITTKRAGNYIP